ncbi:hypothetical protein OEA41_007019 [Lepraria neglecta]|uniref:Uncharacterized protein n=1 Tax=Lepraria neglecta TaxID=209136 RepID=A0AAD9ZBE2_9LECA|nr:hypothetical protein OEA41_007019 [Lepraria neglecta]
MALNGDFDLKLADVIYTVLYKFHPKVLDAFLDVNSHLEFHFERKESPDSDNLNFCIERDNTTCGFLRENGFIDTEKDTEPASKKKKTKHERSRWGVVSDHREI